MTRTYLINPWFALGVLLANRRLGPTARVLAFWLSSASLCTSRRQSRQNGTLPRTRLLANRRFGAILNQSACIKQSGIVVSMCNHLRGRRVNMPESILTPVSTCSTSKMMRPASSVVVTVRWGTRPPTSRRPHGRTRGRRSPHLRARWRARRLGH